VNRERVLVAVSMLLTLGALGLSVYLTVLSFTGSAVAGCSEVLASQWSTIAFVPVSAVGGAIYVIMLVGLALRICSSQPTRLSNDLLMIGAWSIILAACYYTTIQLAVIKAVCPLCMTTHAIGVALGVIVLLTISSKKRSNPTWSRWSLRH